MGINTSVGILVESFDISEMSMSIIQSSKSSGSKLNVFYKGLPDYKIESNSLGLFSIKEAFDFNGCLISTCLNTTKVLLNCYKARSKFFYLWDFEWMQQPMNYLDIYNIYMNDDIELLVRSEDHKALIDKIWKPSTVIEDFKYEQLRKLL